MYYHGEQLPLDRCPHCNIAKPCLPALIKKQTYNDANGDNPRCWATYRCTACGGVVLAVSNRDHLLPIHNIWPEPQTIPEEIPDRAREFLSQAISCLHAPSGAIMLTASAVDAMLKDKGYKGSSLNSRIDAAAKNHLITDEMAAWAHEIRLDANDQRHADEASELPSAKDAEKVIAFANALGQFLYVLPARVARGRKE